MAKVWRSDINGNLFHEACFEVDESRKDFTVVKLDELADDDACESCGGVFLSGLAPLDDVDEAIDEADPEDEE